MAKKGTRKSKKAKKAPAKAPSKTKEAEATEEKAKVEAEAEEKAPTIEPETGAEKPEVPEQPSEPEQEVPQGVPTFQTFQGMEAHLDLIPQPPMVNLLASIRDVGRLKITVPAEKVDEVLEKIWRSGFKQKLASRQRPYRIYGPHMIDKIDVEPIT